MAIEHSITFGGVNSADFGIYISGEGVFNAPKRDVEMISIPGRNGELALDKGRYENIEVTYPAFNYEADYSDFAQNLADFRNAICSQVGYQRLTDTFHPDEYRMATYIDGLEVKPIKYNTASEFEITFNCKPQRWLTSGEDPVTIGEWGETETKSGSIVQIESDGTLGVKSLTASLEPIQSLNGYDKPWSGGNGKNKLLVTATSGTVNGVTLTVNEDGTVKANGTASNSVWLKLADVTLNGSYIINGSPSGGGSSVYALTVNGAYDYGSGASVTLDGTSKAVYLFINNGQTVSNLVFKPMIRLSSETDATFAPYSNICPISGRTEVDTIVSPTTSASDGRTYTTALGRTVYGGSLDVVSGVLTVDRAMVTLDGSENWSYLAGGRGMAKLTLADMSEAWFQDGLSDRFETLTSYSGFGVIFGTNDRVLSVQGSRENLGIEDLASWKSWLASNPTQVVYPLATPQNYQLTAQQVELLLGHNNIWNSEGNSVVEFGQLPNLLINPTQYESSPLLEIAGYGHIQMGESSINIENVPIGNVVLANSGTMQGVRAYYSTEALALMRDGDNITLQAGSLLNRGLAVVGYTSASDVPYGATITVASTSEVQAHVQRVFYMEYYHSCLAELIIDEPITVPKGVEVTKTLALNVSLSYRVNGIEKTWAGSITYDIVFYPTYMYIPVNGHSDSLPSDLEYASIAGERNAEITGMSTMSIFEINHIFADCDLGEAYTIIDGEISSLNAYIDLGSDLPTLGTGANEITYDNTVTELKISPRWWQL